MTLGGHSERAHPSLAKLRDNILNGTIDFAEVPIADMNPEDIRAELKRVYTQLRMYKLKNLYQDNPHISKKRGGKKWSDKTGKVRLLCYHIVTKTILLLLTNFITSYFADICQ
ncbi:unnamed protein product [Nippostrongylus brasiliensis]|uniref:Poor gastrulation (inferred by orthology to a D. melanogaster protein) n=1 Tax=Nippostrongylus brasiliensis TaxID=27835 RepID=A0A0N4XN12_NIPBR|nr:unnamed protein product [Nippostrongylus brasiliensis]